MNTELTPEILDAIEAAVNTIRSGPNDPNIVRYGWIKNAEQALGRGELENQIIGQFQQIANNQ